MQRAGFILPRHGGRAVTFHRLQNAIFHRRFAVIGSPPALHWSDPEVVYGEKLNGPSEIPGGLRYCSDFVSKEEESQLIDILDGNGAAWKRHIRRSMQYFGLVYYQTTHKVAELQPSDPIEERPLGDLPAWLLPRVFATGAFVGTRGVNQVQANEYLGRSGIGLHVEDPAVGGTLATLSLLEPVQLTLQKADALGRPQSRHVRDREDCLKILLEPRSLLILQGESRYHFAHAIRTSRLVPLRGGGTLRRSESYRRLSLTFREVLVEKRSSERQDLPDGARTFLPAHLNGT